MGDLFFKNQWIPLKIQVFQFFGSLISKFNMDDTKWRTFLEKSMDCAEHRGISVFWVADFGNELHNSKINAYFTTLIILLNIERPICKRIEIFCIPSGRFSILLSRFAYLFLTFTAIFVERSRETS